MKNKRTALLLTVLTSLVLFVLTFTQFGKVLQFMMPRIEHVQYQTTDIGSQFKLAIVFAMVMGLVPILLYLTWRLGRIEKTKGRISSVLIVVFSMAISVALRHYLIKSTFSGRTDLRAQSNETVYSALALGNLNYEIYLLGGLI